SLVFATFPLPGADGINGGGLSVNILPGARKCSSGTRYAVFVLLLFAQSSFAQTIPYNGYTAIADEVLVRLKTTDPVSIGRVKTPLPAATFQNLSPSLALHRVRVPGLNFQVWSDVLAKHPDVLYVEPNYIVHAVKTPNDPNYSTLWGLPQVGAPLAWDLTTG